MIINPDERVPIAQARIDKSALAVPMTLLAIAVMLGVGITAFWSIPQMASVQRATIGQAFR
ncbi:MAG: hypothetical protein GEU95_17020 [Rhizobiales bacterium]|nr:hypothetical protein [Hyphomicrobiales bacterium]